MSLMNKWNSQNLLLKVDPLSTIPNNRLIAQGEELETSAKLRVFVSSIIIIIIIIIILTLTITITITMIMIRIDTCNVHFI